MEDLTKRWKSLSLSMSEKERPGLRLKKEQATTSFTIIAKFYTKRPFNLDAVANTFTPLWWSKSGFKVKNLCNHILLFTFESNIEVEHILSSKPWSFDKHILALQRYDKDTTLQDYGFNMVSFWVQVYDILVRFQTTIILFWFLKCNPQKESHISSQLAFVMWSISWCQMY